MDLKFGEVLVSLIRLSISLCVVKKLNGLERAPFEEDSLFTAALVARVWTFEM
jgi:hypothetical protein